MNIIAVDDEKIALRDLEYTIRKACEQLANEQADISQAVLTCFNMADEAIPFARENDVHIAFLDINMGGMNGIELAENLKKINDKTNIVFSTVNENYGCSVQG